MEGRNIKLFIVMCLTVLGTEILFDSDTPDDLFPNTDNLLNSVTSTIGFGNFSYWKLYYDGNVLVRLTSLTGDSDLYISESELKPSFEPEKYTLKSATCGVDEINITEILQRPISIGVYGHSVHSNKYLLEIIRLPDLSKIEVIEEELDFDYNSEYSTIFKLLIHCMCSTSFLTGFLLELVSILI